MLIIVRPPKPVFLRDNGLSKIPLENDWKFANINGDAQKGALIIKGGISDFTH